MDYSRFLSNEAYLKVLQALKDGTPKTGDEICMACSWDDRVSCTGKISFLRRLDAIEQAGRGRFKITDRGLRMLEKAPKVEQRPR